MGSNTSLIQTQPTLSTVWQYVQVNFNISSDTATLYHHTHLYRSYVFIYHDITLLYTNCNTCRMILEILNVWHCASNMQCLISLSSQSIQFCLIVGNPPLGQESALSGLFSSQFVDFTFSLQLASNDFFRILRVLVKNCLS